MFTSVQRINIFKAELNILSTVLHQLFTFFDNWSVRHQYMKGNLLLRGKQGEKIF